MTQTVYTLGYSGRRLDDLVTLARDLAACVFDIRLSANSHSPTWRQPTLRLALGQQYRHVPQLGNLHYRDGGPIEIADFTTGERLIRDWPGPVILMCGCFHPGPCHRTVVSDMLRQLGYQVVELAHPTMMLVPVKA